MPRPVAVCITRITSNQSRPEQALTARHDLFADVTAEGVAVDAQGNVYGTEVGPKAVKKHVKQSGT
jgi:hypothetical protein